MTGGGVRIRRHRARMSGTRFALFTVVLLLVTGVIVSSIVLRPVEPVWHVGMPAPQELATSGDLLDGPPTRVRIPAIGLDAPLTPLRMDDSGELESPENYQVPGWFEEGTLPGDIGPAVIAGHLDSEDGKAVFYRLPEVRPADLVLVQRGGKWLRFQVVSTGRFAKDRFPTAKVYGPTPDPQLRLITCGGWFDRERGSYRDNVVIFAVAVYAS